MRRGEPWLARLYAARYDAHISMTLLGVAYVPGAKEKRLRYNIQLDCAKLIQEC